MADITNAKEMLIYVGTYTKKEAHVDGQGEGIYILGFKPESGKLALHNVIDGIINPSYITADNSNKFLYVANEHWFDLGPEGTVSAFKISKNKKELKLINKETSMGLAPCYVSLDHQDQFLFAANYQTGHFVSFPIQNNGGIGPPIDSIQNQGSGPHEHQDGPHAHSILPDPENNFVIALDKGVDRIFIYRLDQDTGHLTPNNPPYYQTTAGDGPRHFVFHPSGQFSYAINELSSTVIAFTYNGKKGILSPIQRISTLPKNYVGENSCADIHVLSSGRFLYGSNRGHDSIVIYAIDQETGGLDLVDFIPSGGKTPRSFTIDPTGSYILVANQDANNIVVFDIDQHTGLLTETDHKIEVPTPVCLKFIIQVK